MSSPQMRKWVYHRAKKLLDDLDDVPLSDDSIDKKLAILRAGLREASVELFKRAAASSTAEILESKEYQLISKGLHVDAIDAVKSKPQAPVQDQPSIQSSSKPAAKVEMSDFPKFRKL